MLARKLIEEKIRYNADKDILECTDCGHTTLNPNSTSRRALLRHHVEARHLPPGQYPCSQCDKIATTRKGLQNHKQQYHRTATVQNLGQYGSKQAEEKLGERAEEIESKICWSSEKEAFQCKVYEMSLARLNSNLPLPP